MTDRQPLQHTDGSWIRLNQRDTLAEDAAMEKLSTAWKCDIHRFAMLSPIDFYAVRHGRIVAVVELKKRDHDSGKYPTVFLNLRKWLRLHETSAAMDVRAVFVVQFSDGIKYIDIKDIDTRNHKIGGDAKGVSVSSREPVILVNIADMKNIESKET